jgi:hypothetical protein
MPDNWGFVIAAYALAFVVFGGYWRRLARREREVATLAAGRRESTPRSTPGPRAPRP